MGDHDGVRAHGLAVVPGEVEEGHASEVAALVGGLRLSGALNAEVDAAEVEVQTVAVVAAVRLPVDAVNAWPVYRDGGVGGEGHEGGIALLPVSDPLADGIAVLAR